MGKKVLTQYLVNAGKAHLAEAHCYFTRLNLKKNGAFLILLSSIARNSSAPNEKIIFEILWGILEGRTNSAQPYQPCLKNCHNGTFWSVHGIWNFFGPNGFIWGAIKVPFFDYLKNPSKDFENPFCLWFLWISSNAGRQNWRGPIF